MKRGLRILHLEDDSDYAELVRSILLNEGFEFEVELAVGREDYEAALERGPFDLILADYLLPGYNGLAALQTARQAYPETPFLLVSGTIGEQAAIESLRAGATDYVLKLWPERLVPAIRRAIQESEERKNRLQMEGELARRENYFRTLIENSLDIVTLLDSEARFIYNSSSVARVLGYEPRELKGDCAFSFVHPEDVPSLLTRFRHCLARPADPVTVQFRCRHRDGSWRFLEAVCHNQLADPDVSGIVINSRDITDRKQAEQNLQDSERRFRCLFEGSPDAIFVEDFAGVVLDVNPAACALHGLSRDGLVGRSVFDLVPPEARAEVARDFKLLTEGRLQKVEGVSRRGDGQCVPVELSGSRLDYAGQRAVVLHARDVTDRRLAEAALRSSEMLFHSVWDNSADGMRLTDAEGMIVAVNEAFCRLVGMPREELEGRPFTAAHSATEDAAALLERHRKRFRERVDQRRVERRLSLRNGQVLVLEENTSFVELRGQGLLLLSLFRDVTGQKRLEEQLRQSQKLEAIGQLAGGVAHDFNNILTVIQGHASLLRLSCLPENAGRSAQQIAQAADRAAALTRQLLAFSRQQVTQPQSLDLNEVVGNMTRMLGRILGEDITLQVHYSGRPAIVSADAGMMEQVLLNLSVNARDAMPKGGLLKIGIGLRAEARPPITPDSEARPGPFVCLSVSDTGCGISPEILPRIFEPFFTTKEVGRGTGLGLATVYGIIKQHHGWIEVASEPGKGATFEVYLPQCPKAAGHAQEAAQEAPARGGTETILVVEDERPVRDLVCGLLTARGYKVFEAESAPRALEIWSRHKGQIDLLLTDLVMPDQMNGRELAEQLKAEQPALKVVFTSGYCAETFGKDFALSEGATCLQKPYPPSRLAATVRECLDSRN